MGISLYTSMGFLNPKRMHVWDIRFVVLPVTEKQVTLHISGVDHSSDESWDTHCIILYGEFIMSAVNHPPHAADPVTGAEEKS